MSIVLKKICLDVIDLGERRGVEAELCVLPEARNFFVFWIVRTVFSLTLKSVTNLSSRIRIQQEFTSETVLIDYYQSEKKKRIL